MSIPQAAFGFVVAVALVFEAAAPSSRANEPLEQAAMLQHATDSVVAGMRKGRDAVLDATLDRLGDVIALVKQI